MEGDEPTQATQNVLDPRRVGKQNSGFSDDDISDIICVLYPHSDSARLEVQKLVAEDSPHIIGKDVADDVELDYELEDHASRFGSRQAPHGDFAIILRLSARIKTPSAGFTFGRNTARCDVVFSNDPLRRVSNVHFRIYVNEYGNVMIEDHSTNGTSVDNQILTSHPKTNANPITKWVLSSGSVIRIFLDKEIRDLTFRVRIPRRDEEYDRAYIAKVDDYFARHGLKASAPATAAPHTGGHVDLFKTPAEPIVRRITLEPAPDEASRPSTFKRKEVQSVMRREWTGSGKYNRIGTIGKGAFAVVYKVTSKFDGRPYAAKEIEKRRFVKNGVLDQKVENEMKIMRRVNHPNIVRYMDNFEWDDRLLIIIMEFVPCGDLGRLISDEGAFPEDMAQTMAWQLLSALGYLHANKITHRDVKPDNILVNTFKPLEVKLTDFGLSKIVETEQTFLRTFCGTLLYCAPEVYTEYAEYDDNGVRNRGKKMRRLPGQRYSHAVDIWSLGGVLFFALTCSPPYPVKSGISPSELLHKVMSTMLSNVPLERYKVSEQGIDFLHRMLQRRPESRATIPELESHAWLGGPDSVIQASQSYDEITDEEDLAMQSHLPRAAQDENDDHVSDSAGDESEKENDVARRPPPPRLFGEVAASDIGSSVVLPPRDGAYAADKDRDMRQTKAAVKHWVAEDGSGDSDVIGWSRRQARSNNMASVCPVQSADQLESLVEDVASQSLNGQPFRKDASHSPSVSMDPNSSKRKPPSHDAGNDVDENTLPGKPIIKRFKSDGEDEVTEDEVREFKLLACIPQIRRLGSGRQVDGPVNKMTFWEQDQKTWHLQYPEMTQLQYDAFLQASRDREEDFSPGKTPLWDLAMRHFPPGPGPRAQGGAAVPRSKMADEGLDIPSTATTLDAGADQPPSPTDLQIVVPVQDNPASNRAMAVIESLPESCIPGVSFPITDSLTSFGRGPENTEVFRDRLEPRMPKYAFKILLWKEGYDPSKDPSKLVHPWQRASSTDDGSYHFWISTKATVGIRVNGCSLASSDSRNPSGPSQHWTKIHDGDCLTVWRGQDPGIQTKLIFRCFWGGSARARGAKKRQLELASDVIAHKLDVACQKTERRIRELSERRSKVDDAKIEHQERLRRVDKERERSDTFEKRRAEAIEYLTATRQLGSRRTSPAYAWATGTGGQAVVAGSLNVAARTGKHGGVKQAGG